MSANHKQKFIFFVAEMVMLLICVSRGRDCQQVATSISSQMEKVSRSLKDGDLKVREEQRKYSAVFIENFQEVIFQSKNFSLGQKILIGNSSYFYSRLVIIITVFIPVKQINPFEVIWKAAATAIDPLFSTHFPTCLRSFVTLPIIVIRHI